MANQRDGDDRIQVLIVDDSALMRNLIGRIVDSAPDLTVQNKAMNGRFALQKLERQQPDVIVLDLEMPEMNGIEFLKARRDRQIDIPVIILSSVAVKGAKITMDALSLGASDFITKPSGSVSHDIKIVADELIGMIRGYGESYRRKRKLPAPPTPTDFAVRTPGQGQDANRVEVDKIQEELRSTEDTQKTGGGKTEAAARSTTVPHTPDRSAPPFRRTAPPRTPKTTPGHPEIVAVGISTGGPNALRKMMAGLDPDFPVPIVVVQHMPEGFTEEFARSLDRVCQLEVKEASDGDLVKPGRVLIAPGNHHITVERRSLGTVARINQDPPRNGHRPSVDVLFESVANEFGNRALAIIMTGMGRDGAQEIGAIYEAGGMTIGQDQSSSVVYGMPRVAFENGYLHKQVSLSEMANTINEYVATVKAPAKKKA